MRIEISAGGVVVFGNAILLLKKYNGDWVLPKGRVKKNEKLEDAAVREVYEESNVKAEIIQFIGNSNYFLKPFWNHEEEIDKTVYWYMMKAKNMECVPLKTEGFIEAKYVHIERAIEIARYEDEKKVIELVKNLNIKDLTIV